MSIAYFFTFFTIEIQEQIKIRFHRWLGIAIWIISSDFVDSTSLGVCYLQNIKTRFIQWRQMGARL